MTEPAVTPSDAPAQAPQQAPSRPAPRSGLLHLLSPLLWVVSLLLLVVGSLAGSMFWLAKSEAGSQWLLPRLPGVQVSGWQGALLGRRLAADRLQVDWPGGKIVIEGLLADGVQWTWRPDDAAWIGLAIGRLHARSIDLQTGPSSGQPLAAPASLEFPFRLQLAELRVATLQIDALAPLRGVEGALMLGAEGGARHRIDGLRFDWDQIRLQASASITGKAPLTLSAEASVAPLAAVPDAEPAWTAQLRASGPLALLEAGATLRGSVKADARPVTGARAGTAASRAAPSLDLESTIAPFAAWPLVSLAAQTQALDLAALASAAPETRLSGRVDIDSRALDAPISARLALSNALPGRWDENRLPLTNIELELRGRADQRDRVEIPTFDLALGSPRRPAGRWSGSGSWQGDTLQLDTRLQDVQPQQLDGRAAAMRLAGTLGFTVSGLPSPDGQTATAAAPAASATPATPGTPGPAPARPWAATVRAQLDGRMNAAPMPVQITLEASADALGVDVRQLLARAGAARAELSASARRMPANSSIAGMAGIASAPWQLRSSGQFNAFDPTPWWPGEVGSAWRVGPHRLSGDWRLDVRLPAGAERLAPLALAQQLAGTGNLKVNDSLLAGVPVALTLTLDSTPAAATAPSGLRGELRMADNVLTIDGRGNPRGTGVADRWQFTLDAGKLAALAPLFKLHPALAGWLPKQGSASARIAVQGRWPKLATEGEATLSKLQLGEVSLEQASSQWKLATYGEQALELQADVKELRFGRQRLTQLHAELNGTPAKHRLEMTAALPLAPPAAAEQLFGLGNATGTRASLSGDGAWLADAKGGGRWIGHVIRLAAGAWDGKSLTGPARGDWLDASDLRAELHFDAEGQLDLLQAAPGRLRVADALALRWDEVRIDLSGPLPKIDLRAEVEAFQVAPLLARLQPTMGWGGDLRLGASIDIRAGERFDADLVVERRDGDLQIVDDKGTQTLGLSDLRLSLTAHDGQWTFAQALAGRVLGEMAGAVNVRTAPGNRWPAADAPVEGVVQARVANIGIWGAWVPPGWRLSGELMTSATIGGTFGAPEYTGQVRGSGLAVRNLFEGVNVSQGEVAIALTGASAQIERFTLRAGDGSLNITGGAEFGEKPNARLLIDAQRFRVLGRVDRQLTMSGKAELNLNADQVKLDGQLNIDEGLFDISRGNAPTLDSDVTIIRKPGAGADEAAAEPAPPPRPRREAQVALVIDLGNKLRVRGHGIDTTLGGSLNVSTPGGRLAVRGTVSTVDGTYAAWGQRLAIERGIVAFSGLVDNPRLDILALRPNIDTRVGVSITGTAQNPRVRLYSEPDMSDTDKLSWLMLGRAPDGLGSADTALLQRAALALLAGDGESATDGLLGNIGLDTLSFRQSDGETRETVVTVGKQISRRWYVGYERGVNATAGTWQLIYRIAQRFTLRAQSGNDNSIDLIWVWRVGEPVLGGMPKSSPAPATPPP